MFQVNLNQKPTVSLILGFLIILQVVCIGVSYSINFDDYIVLVVVVLSFLIAYFSYHYLKLLFQRTNYFQAISEVTSTQQQRSLTEKQVEKLTKTEEYKQYELKWKNKQLIKTGVEHQAYTEEQEQTTNEEVQKVVDELLQNEDKIFDL